MLIKQNESLKNKVIEYIYEAVLNEDYLKGEQIKEVPLSNNLKVSRAPIREELYELVSLGILEHIERRGVFVKEINNKDILDTYAAKGLLEGYLARSFAVNATEYDIYKLEKIILEMSDHTNDQKTVAKLGSKFHKYYIKYATHDFLIESLGKLNKKSQLLFSRNWSKLYTMNEIKKRHEKIVSVLKTRDEKNIEECIKEHYIQTGMKIVQLNNLKG